MEDHRPGAARTRQLRTIPRRSEEAYGEQQNPGGLSCKLLQNQANHQRFSHKARRLQRKAQCFSGRFLS
jgi:hypothetical protein